MEQQAGFQEAQAAILAGRATAHSLWQLISNESDREGYALKPVPWEGSGEYQRVEFADGRDVYVRIPFGKRLINRECRMKTAKLRIAAYFVDCPQCGEGIGAPDNESFLWPVDMPVKEKTMTCSACNTRFKLPRALLEA